MKTLVNIKIIKCVFFRGFFPKNFQFKKLKILNLVLGFACIYEIKIGPRIGPCKEQLEIFNKK